MQRPTVPTERATTDPVLRRSILVVDADADTLALYRQTFESLGYDVVEASDGREALTKALVRPPTLVVTELTLPFVDGYALCDILRRDPATTHVPIVAVTAEARPVHVQRAQHAGADVVLVKPVSVDRIVAELERLVRDVTDPYRGGAATGADATTPPNDSILAGASTEPLPRRSQVKRFARFTTTTPPRSPFAFVCPSCDRPLIYDRSHIGGVNARQAEQWDCYTCESCGRFQYRQRTRKLSRIVESERDA